MPKSKRVWEIFYQTRRQNDGDGRYFIKNDAKMMEMVDQDPEKFGGNLFKLVLTCANWSKLKVG